MKTTIALATALAVLMPLSAAAQDRSSAAAEPSPSPTPTPEIVDLNSSRLLLWPTGRPLSKGDGYFSDHMLVLPSATYGLTNHLSVSAGVTTVPGLGMGEQFIYVAPRLAAQLTPTAAVSGGVLYGRGGLDGDDNGLDLGVAYSVATFGKPDRSLSLGGGVARTSHKRNTGQYVRGAWQTRYETVVEHTPMLVAGGNVRVAKRLALVSENWLVLDDNFSMKDQPFSLAVRFMGDRLSADLGVVLMGSMLEEGFPLPWLSITYGFSGKK